MDSVSCQSDHEIDKNVVEGDINKHLTPLTGDITKEVYERMLEECIESSITLVERDENDVLDSDGECSISDRKVTSTKFWCQRYNSPASKSWRGMSIDRNGWNHEQHS